MKLTATIIAAAIAVSSFAQNVNYRIGGIVGKGDLYGVVGVNLFEIHDGLWAETVTFTPLAGVSTELPMLAGFGVMREWNQPRGYSVNAGVSVLAPVGTGWSRVDNLKIGASIGVKF